jgi:putative ABC transport system ATP-binding protein
MELDNLVATEGLTKLYSSGKIAVKALDNVNISLQYGRFWAIAGASGSGKSTLMNLLGGLDSPTSGKITVRGKVVSELNQLELANYRRFEVGMIFQSFNLISSYTAVENVALPLLFSGVPKKTRNSRAEEMLVLVGLEHRKDHHPAELSGGEQQRVSIARALINQPQLLLADEPTGNLDSGTARQIMQILAKLNKEKGLSIIMISHEEYLLREFADGVIRLHDGKVSETEQIR